VIPPLAVDGPLLSIRRFGSTPLTADDLLRHRTLTPQMLETLRSAVRARLNIVISGGTGSGKTTLLNVLSGYISNAERIVTMRTPPNCRSSRSTSRAWSAVRPTWRARAPSASASW